MHAFPYVLDNWQTNKYDGCIYQIRINLVQNVEKRTRWRHLFFMIWSKTTHLIKNYRSIIQLIDWLLTSYNNINMSLTIRSNVCWDPLSLYGYKIDLKNKSNVMIKTIWYYIYDSASFQYNIKYKCKIYFFLYIIVQNGYKIIEIFYSSKMINLSIFFIIFKKILLMRIKPKVQPFIYTL